MDTQIQERHHDTAPANDNAQSISQVKAGPSAAGQPKLPGDRIVVLTGGGPLPWVLTNALVERFGPLTILKEDKEPLKVMVRRRAKMLGLVEAAGQVGFGVWLKILHKLSRDRKQQIVASENLDTAHPSSCKTMNIGSVNSKQCAEALKKLAPDVVVVIGTRMIKAKTLNSTNAIFMNYHAGLNPKYRGMNGGYWALAMGEPENLGITMHLVDEGVDTGKIISIERLSATPRDNFTTIPMLQAARGRSLVIKAVEDALAGKLKTMEVPMSSKQWFHPTLWGYLRTGVVKRVW